MANLKVAGWGALMVMTGMMVEAPIASAQSTAQSSVNAPVDVAPSSLSVGIRIGGYGFRDVTGHAEGAWRDCRMNGVGLVLDYEISGPWFVESGLDFYFAKNSDEMDRMSGLLNAAIGARFARDFFISPYVQLGAGGEVTRVKVQHHGLRETRVLPFGFLGVGFDLNLGDHVRIGSTMRMAMMGHFPHDHAHDHGGAVRPGDQEPNGLSAEAELVGMMQFYVRYRF